MGCGTVVQFHFSPGRRGLNAVSSYLCLFNGSGCWLGVFWWPPEAHGYLCTLTEEFFQDSACQISVLPVAQTRTLAPEIYPGKDHSGAVP